MNNMNEFKKIKNNNETRYVLETMTAGATGASAIATAEKDIGEVQKRIPDTSKPRNFVAKNAKMGGAGQHKDKKKAEKQGDVKHRKPFAEQGVAEGLQARLAELKNKVKEAYGRYDRRDAYQRDYDSSISGMDRGNNHRDDERHDLDPSDWYIVKDGKMFKVTVYPNQEQEAMSRGYSRTRDEAKAKAGLLDKQQGVREGVRDLGYDAQSLIMKLRRDVEERRLQPTRQAVLSAARELAGDMDFAPELLVRQVLGQGVAEGERTMSRAAKGNEKYGKDGMKALAKAGREGASDEKLDAIRDKHDNYNEGLRDPKDNPCWNGYKPVGTKKKAGKTVPNCVPKESSVAEVAPPGWGKTVKAMKKHDNIDNPFALAWSMKNKGYKSHKKESADPYFESLRSRVEELAKK